MNWETVRPLAQNVMETIINAPCNSIVHSQVITPKGPMSFDTIMENIKNNVYKEYKDWDKDCRTYITYMAESYKNHPIELVIIKHIRILYLKLLQKCFYSTAEGWTKRINNLRVKIDDLLRTVPDCMKKYSQLMPMPHSSNFQLQRSDLEAIAKFDQRITDNIDLMHLMRIVCDDPGALEVIGDYAKLDVAKLRSATQIKLYMFLKEKIESEKK